MSTTHDIFLAVGGPKQDIQAVIMPDGASAAVLSVAERFLRQDWVEDVTLGAAWRRVVWCAPVFSALWRSRTAERPPSIRLSIHSVEVMPT